MAGHGVNGGATANVFAVAPFQTYPGNVMQSRPPLTPDSWLEVLKRAYLLFDDLEARGLGKPPLSFGGGTVLMLDYKHRLSRDIDFFTYDVQWISFFSPRLNDMAARLATDYVEQANSVKIVTEIGDIDIIAASDLTHGNRSHREIAGRVLAIDPPAEILAKKLFYRAAALQPRDVYDMATVIDLAPREAMEAARVTRSKHEVLLRRLNELATRDASIVTNEIIPYDRELRHAGGMIAKVRDFILGAIVGPSSGSGA